MSKPSFEIANAYAQIMEICEASLDPKTEDYGIDWEEAFDQTGADPELRPVILLLLESGRPEIRQWVERQTGAQLPA